MLTALMHPSCGSNNVVICYHLQYCPCTSHKLLYYAPPHLTSAAIIVHTVGWFTECLFIFLFSSSSFLIIIFMALLRRREKQHFYSPVCHSEVTMGSFASITPSELCKTLKECNSSTPCICTLPFSEKAVSWKSFRSPHSTETALTKILVRH